MAAMARGLVAGVDVGGTFTDVVLLRAGAAPVAVKVPTSTEDQSLGVVEGLARARARQVPDLGMAGADVVAHGTTAATNAVLERAVARTVLVTTAGFGDVLAIGRQDRPSLYDLAIVRPVPLVPGDLVVTVRERCSASGDPVVVLTEEALAELVARVAALAPEAVAVSLLFSWANPEHEIRVCAMLEERLPGVPVTRSSALVPEFREFERASTVALNAAVAPLMGRYLGALRRRLDPAAVTVMTSGGGTATVEQMREAPVHTLLSGPAAGVVAAAAVAVGAGFADAVAFDMGGTSTDVCLIRDGRPDMALDAELDGMPVRTPAVAVHTVGAGGGSIAALDPGGALRVGPRSAGAVPGPACYSRGGVEPTVTDAHCLLGHLDQRRPLAGGAVTLDVHAARASFARLGEGVTAGDVIAVVRAAMARALRRVTTERGVDPGALTLVAYGGAGPLHATALARDIGLAAVVIPPVPGVLSALGLLLAAPRSEASRTVMAAPDDDLENVWEELEHLAAAEVRRHGVEAATRTRIADLRYRGQSHELRVALSGDRPLTDLLATAHAERYGYALEGEPVEVTTLRVVAEGPPALARLPETWGDVAAATRAGVSTDRPAGDGTRAAQPGRLVDRAGLRSGDRVAGPAIVVQADATTILEREDVAVVDAAGNLVVRW